MSLELRDGRIVAPGSFQIKQETWFDGGTLPSWLTLRSDGDYAGASVDAHTGPARGVNLKTAASASKRACLRTPEFALSDYAAVCWRVVLTGGRDTLRLPTTRIQAHDFSNGTAFTQTTTGPVVRGVDAAGTVTAVDAPLFPWSDDTVRYDLTLWVTTADRNVYLMEGDASRVHAVFPPEEMALDEAAGQIDITGFAGATTGASIAVHYASLTRYVL